MNISSTPFIRNDYWPDYNDINQVNQRIDDVENEISLVNIRLSTDIENVSNNLNTYAKEQADTSTSNNIIVNNLNANYAEGRFANFDNTFTNNAYVENLTVNKPVFDITLNTPHLENTTSLNGNFYTPNIIDAKISGDVSGNLNNISINDLFANNANISNLYVNTSPTPVQSSAVLGYDSEGKVIPIRATFEVGFPENADYLWTDEHGTAFGGVKATEIGEVENLITAYGVKNAIDALNVEVVDNFNLVNDNVNNISQWQSSFENAVTDNFNDVANNLNDVANNLNDVANNLNEINANIESSVSTLNNTTNNISNSLDSLISILEPVLGVTDVSGWNSLSPVNIQGIKEFRVAPLAAPTMAGSDVGNGAKLNLSGTVATLGLPSFQWTTENMRRTFSGCTKLNQNVLIPNGVVNMLETFRDCANLNQNILIPNSVAIMLGTFGGCSNLNQNILIPNSVVNMLSTFSDCRNLNQNILIPNSVASALFSTFSGCTSLNQNILIPNSVVSMYYTFSGCINLNQNILIPNSVTDMFGTFRDCSNLNQSDIYIYSQNLTQLANAFSGCRINNIHVPTSVPKSASNHIYNSLVNGVTGISFPAANIFNDLPVDIEQWPPV